MAITLTCSHCQQTLSVRDEFAGKRGKCPKCQTVMSIPRPEMGAAHAAPSHAAHAATASRPTAATTKQSIRTASNHNVAPPRATSRIAPPPPPPPIARAPAGDLYAQVFSSFHGTISRVQATPAYQVGILLTALLMIVLPLVYLGIIGLVCFAVWWHLTHHYVMIGAVHGKAVLFALVAYLAPLVIGTIVIAFMLKPLFAHPAKEGRRRSITPHSDPLLFEFVDRICALVGAPPPHRIDVDCQINASASFRRGWLSLFSGRDLVLTIGIPLAAGLSLQQFAGVLAHEFGHFSQGVGMRLTYVIRSINMWFLRVVYQRDDWDVWLETAADGVDIRIGWIILVARGCVWLTRRILWLLMYVGHVAAGYMLRQMEFDADKYEARVAGSETFASTARQLRLLAVAWSGAEADFSAHSREGRLADNLPLLMVANLRQLPQEAQTFVDKMIAETKTGMFDSHPADLDRILSARREQSPGVFRSSLPATVLFGDFTALAKGVSWDQYCAEAEKVIDPKTLHSTEELIARTDNQQAAAKSRDRFFAGGFTLLRPLALPVLDVGRTEQPKIWQEELRQARETMDSLAGDYRQAIRSLDEADTRVLQARQARAVLSTGVPLLSERFEIRYESTTDASRKRDAALSELARIGNRLEPFESAAGRRLRADLMLLFHPAVAARIEGAAEMQADCRRLAPLVSQISSLHASLIELRNCNATLAALLGHLEGNERSESLIREVLDYTARVRAQAADLRALFERADYPFDHAQGPLSIAQFLIPMIPPADEIGAVFNMADQVMNKLMDLDGRAISRLCQIAEAVEAALGYQPLVSGEPA